VPNGVICSSLLVAGAAAMTEANLIDTEKVFHGWGDSLQDGAFQQLVTHAQERYGWITCSKMWIFDRFCQGYDLRLSPDLWDSLFPNLVSDCIGLFS